MKARDLMTSPALTVPSEASREAVAALLVSHGIASAPVVDAAGHLLGVVDETDLVRAGEEADAGALMSREVTTIDPDTPLADVVARLMVSSTRALVVLRDGAVLGVVSRRDVLRRVARGELTAPLAPSAPQHTDEAASVVVGVDGSDASIEALRWAADEARRAGAALRAVIAYGQPDLYGAVAPLERHARLVLDEAVEKALGPDAGAVVREVHEGHAVPVLVAAGRGARLLVVGCRGTGGFPGMRVGSVSTHLVGHAPCPMVLVPHGSDPTS